jgi:hypothetical protein
LLFRSISRSRQQAAALIGIWHMFGCPFWKEPGHAACKANLLAFERLITCLLPLCSVLASCLQQKYKKDKHK